MYFRPKVMIITAWTNFFFSDILFFSEFKASDMSYLINPHFFLRKAIFNVLQDSLLCFEFFVNSGRL